MDSLARRDQFSGVVAINRNDASVIRIARGMADRAAQRPNDAETGFNLGSINKVFTRIAVQQLAAQGRLSPDSTLGHYWPDYPNAPVRSAEAGYFPPHSLSTRAIKSDGCPSGSASTSLPPDT